MNGVMSFRTVRFLLLALLLAWVLSESGARAAGEEAIETVGPGRVNWTTGLVTATGIGAPPAHAVNQAQARAMAERAAHSVAVRNLLEAVRGIQVDSASLVENYMVKSEVIKTRVSGLIKGAQRIKTDHQPDGSVEVTVGIALAGEFLDAIISREFGKSVSITGPSATAPPRTVPIPSTPSAPQKAEVPAPQAPSVKPAEPVPPPKAPAAIPPVEPAPSADAYTGLIVDARGLGLKPALVPRLLDEQGKELYAGDVLTRDQAVQAGVAGYSKDMIAGSRQPRVTDNPLIVKGVRVSGNKATDIVLGEEGVKAIQQSEPSAHYLRQARVVVVYD
jgi:hypothetical protein